MENNIPFSTPPAAFVQTGNQVTVDETPFGVSETDPFATATPVPGPFGAAPTDPFSGAPPVHNNYQPQEKTKYQILDMFWMLNQKQPAQGEAHFVVISYNISFGNLRISFFDRTANSIQGNIAYLDNFKRTVSGTIYPATAFNVSKSPSVSTTCLEQLFKQIPGANWQQERPVCVVQKNQDLIRFTVKDPKYGTYIYDFTGWQREAFIYACEFAYTEGFKLMSQNLLK